MADLERFRDKFRGCIIGQALGDATGFVAEGCSTDECRRYVEEVLQGERGEMPRRPPFRFGQYSDDTQLARELMESYAECGGFDPGDYASRIAAIFSEGRIVGRGRATSQAASRLAAGVPWEEAGTPSPAAGNGSAMRAGPVGLFCYDDPDGLVRVAHDQGRMTHRDSRCGAGAVMVAGAVALAMGGEPVRPGRWLDFISEWASRIDPAFGGCVKNLLEWLPLAPEDALPLARRSGLQDGYRDHWSGISPFVVGSVMWSLYAFLKSPEDYWQTICTAIAPGGDVDTTAAMAGAISGARVGLKGIPEDLARRINDRGIWGYERLIGLADRCLQVKTS